MISSMLFALSVQPMMIISSLILMILLFSLLIFWNMSSFWFSYMLVLIFMSGVMVVFTYMMSVLPNESFETSSLVMVVMMMMMILEYKNIFEFMENNSLMSMMIWSGVTWLMSIFLVLYLLMMMIMIVWLSMMEKGAVRIN